MLCSGCIHARALLLMLQKSLRERDGASEVRRTRSFVSSPYTGRQLSVSLSWRHMSAITLFCNLIMQYFLPKVNALTLTHTVFTTFRLELPPIVTFTTEHDSNKAKERRAVVYCNSNDRPVIEKTEFKCRLRMSHKYLKYVCAKCEKTVNTLRTHARTHF